MRYRRMPIEIESPEQLGYETITNNLSESSVADRRLCDLGVEESDHLVERRLPRPLGHLPSPCAVWHVLHT